MKKDLHPEHKDVTFSCACGATFVAGSTYPEETFKTEICSACHPFYTGKQKLIDSSGRVDKFMAKMKKAKAIADEKAKDSDEDIEEEVVEEKTEEVKEEKPKKEAKEEEKAEEVKEEPKEEEKAEEVKEEPKEEKKKDEEAK